MPVVAGMSILLNKYLEAPNREIKHASKYQQKQNRNSDRLENGKRKLNEREIYRQPHLNMSYLKCILNLHNAGWFQSSPRKTQDGKHLQPI